MDIPYIPVTMVRKDLRNLPVFPLPAGYRMRNYEPGDEAHWAAIEQSAGEFETQAQALAHFQKEFGNDLADLKNRLFFLCDEGNRSIGTANAWFRCDFHGDLWGRLHWIAICPEHQGRGLSKPMTAYALQRLAQSHDKAYLTTQTTSFVAVKVYLDLGFEPFLETEKCPEGWRLLKDLLRHPKLNAF